MTDTTQFPSVTAQEERALSTRRRLAKRLLTPSMLLRFAFALVVVVIFATPYLWMIGSTFKTRQEIFRYIHPLSWRTFVPLEPTLQNIQRLFADFDFAQPLINSIGVSIAAVVFSMIINSMIAFVLAWIDFPGRRLLFLAILATLMIAFEAKLVPLFLIMQNLGLHNTYASIFLPWITDAFIIFLLRQHFRELPVELFEAAILDGCSYFRIFWNVMLPNVVPALVSAAFIKFVFSWDSFIWPSITITDQSKTVVTVAIAKLFSDENVLWELIFAGSFIATIPILLLFLFLQRYYVEGMTHAGVKG